MEIPQFAAVRPPGDAQLKLPTPMRIATIEEDNYRTRTLTLEGELEAEPGQFVMAWLPRFDEKPFSLVSASPLRLMITAVGPFTRLVHGLDVGDLLWVRGAFGRPFQLPEPGKRVALVAGGYGVAPLYWLAHSILARGAIDAGWAGTEVTAILGAREGRDLLYLPRFSALKAVHDAPPNVARAGFEVLTTTDDGSVGLAGRVTDALAPLLAADRLDAIYGCGPDAMLTAIQGVSVESGIPAQLSWEAYMRCGVGLCGSCEHQGQLLCLDGPVLPG